MTAVLDASASMAILTGSVYGEACACAIQDEGEVLVPGTLYLLEVSNALRKYVGANIIAEEECNALLEKALVLIDAVVAPEELLKEALHESIRLNHPVYDMLYFVLARRNNALLCTLDKRLAALCVQNGVSCTSVVELS